MYVFDIFNNKHKTKPNTRKHAYILFKWNYEMGFRLNFRQQKNIRNIKLYSSSAEGVR